MQEPLAGLLDFLEGCVTVQKGKTTTLNHFILTEFMRWRTNNPQASLNGLREEEKLRLQQQALGLLTDSHPGYMDPLLEIYQLSTLKRPLLLEHVAFLHDCRCFKEVRGSCHQSIEDDWHFHNMLQYDDIRKRKWLLVVETYMAQACYGKCDLFNYGQIITLTYNLKI